jgi:hypothetical protein
MKETVKANSSADDIHHFLTNLISQQPRILILVEQDDPDIQEACENLRIVPDIMAFKTLVKVGADIKTHAHLFQPLVKVEQPPQQNRGPSPPSPRLRLQPKKGGRW